MGWGAIRGEGAASVEGVGIEEALCRVRRLCVGRLARDGPALRAGSCGSWARDGSLLWGWPGDGGDGLPRVYFRSMAAWAARRSMRDLRILAFDFLSTGSMFWRARSARAWSTASRSRSRGILAQALQ